MPPQQSVTMQAAADTIALAWVYSRYTGYLAGTGTARPSPRSSAPCWP